MQARKYLNNCFLLLIPILVWNLVLTPYLPVSFSADTFWNEIPNWIFYTENTLRIIVMAMPAVMVLSLKTESQKLGFGCYLSGMVLYFLSWLPLILFPNSTWSLSIFGFMAPAYTPVIWLTGIGLIGTSSFLNIRNLTPIYISLSFLFVIVHAIHAFVVYQRLQDPV